MANNTTRKKPSGTKSTKAGGIKNTKPVAKKKLSKKKKNKIVKKALIGLGLLAVVYMLFAFYFSSHFLPRTVINGYSCQFKTAKQVKKMITEGCGDYTLLLEEREDKQEQITSEQVDLQFIDDGKVEKLQKEQNQYAWIAAVFKKPVYENALTFVYDEEGLLDAIDSLGCMAEENMEAPVAAYPAYNEANERFEIVKEELGTEIAKESFVEKIREAILSHQRVLNLSEEECYVKPAFFSEDAAIIEATDKMNRYLSTEITYDMGYTEVEVEKSWIAKWLTTDEEANVVVDEDKVEDYVDWLGLNYNTCGIPRTFQTPENTTVTVSGGTYGWRIHFDKEVMQLCQDVTTGEKIKREPIYRQTAYNRDANGNDLHDTYVAISISAQTMWYYKNGQCLLTTPVVTGNVSKNMGTPTGVYDIAAKQRDHVLRGEDYESPVDYWLPFYQYRGIGIHDASWRAEDAFGKEIYLTNGSHGCVNTPYEAVKQLFELVREGTPVVVY